MPEIMNPREDYLPSDCESGVSGPDNDEREASQFQNNDRLVRISEEDEIYGVIKKRVVFSLSSYSIFAEINGIQRTRYSNIMNKARHLSFGIYTKAMEAKCKGDANVKYAWYGCCSKQEMETILLHGFSLPERSKSNGYGVHLSVVDHPVQSVLSLPKEDEEEDEMKYLLLCRVILGKTEEITPGSGQFNPSSEEFDSGVDNLSSPRKYIIWASCMNSFILPEFVVSFRTVYRDERILQSQRRPKSAWMPFQTLLNELSKLLPSNQIKLLINHYKDHKKKKITRDEMIQRVRQIAGDKLLIFVIKSHREKMKSCNKHFQ